MKALKLTGLLLLGSAISAFGIVTMQVDTIDSLSLDFTITDNALSPADIDIYTTVNFPAIGSIFAFGFDDRWAKMWGGSGNLEALWSSNGIAELANEDYGSVTFTGSYLTGGYSVDWGLTSKVRTRLGNDTWSGNLSAESTYVPDGGITLMLLGLGLSGLAFGRRFMKG